jgi:hypothetical protein
MILLILMIYVIFDYSSNQLVLNYDSFDFDDLCDYINQINHSLIG